MIIKGSIPKNLKDCDVSTFEEEYSNYLKRCKSNKFRTEEYFSTEFDSTLQDLRKSFFVKTNNEELIKVLTKRLNVIEII